MKTYKDTLEIERSLDFITSIIKETFMIGGMQFFIRAYILEEMDDIRNLFGCFLLDSTNSPVFETYTECLKYAMKLYNEKSEEINGKNCMGDPAKNSKRGE